MADLATLDEKLIAKYGIDISERERADRKRRGLANMQYKRYQNWFLLLVTEGHHPFKQQAKKQIRDCRRYPIKFEGYSISYAASRNKLVIGLRVAHDEPGHLGFDTPFVCKSNQFEMRPLSYLAFLLLQVGQRNGESILAADDWASPQVSTLQQVSNIQPREHHGSLVAN